MTICWHNAADSLRKERPLLLILRSLWVSPAMMLADRGAGDSVFRRGPSDCGVAEEARPPAVSPGELRVGEALQGEGPPLAPPAPAPALESPSACTRRQRLAARRCLAGLGPPVAAVSACAQFCSHGSSAACISMQQYWRVSAAAPPALQLLQVMPEQGCFAELGLLAAAVCTLRSRVLLKGSVSSRIEPRSNHSNQAVAGALRLQKSEACRAGASIVRQREGMCQEAWELLTCCSPDRASDSVAEVTLSSPLCSRISRAVRWSSATSQPN